MGTNKCKCCGFTWLRGHDGKHSCKEELDNKEVHHTKSEFCKMRGCRLLTDENDEECCEDDCKHSAYDYYNWLIGMGFKLVKK